MGKLRVGVFRLVLAVGVPAVGSVRVRLAKRGSRRLGWGGGTNSLGDSGAGTAALSVSGLESSSLSLSSTAAAKRMLLLLILQARGGVPVVVNADGAARTVSVGDRKDSVGTA